jgi:hypothetical protein
VIFLGSSPRFGYGGDSNLVAQAPKYRDLTDPPAVNRIACHCAQDEAADLDSL